MKSEDSITITGETMLNFIRDKCIYHDSYRNYFDQYIHKCEKNNVENINDEPECFSCMNCEKYLYPNVKEDIINK